MTRRERSRQARRKWQRLISEQAGSGQSVTAFCRRRGLCRTHFCCWKKRLQAGDASRTPLTKFLEVKLTPAGPEGAAAVPARRAEAPAGAAADQPSAGDGRVEVVLRNGRSLWVGRGFDAGHVRALAAVLESEA